MLYSKQDLSTLKLRTTLNELKQFTGRQHYRSHNEAPPIGITLISIQSYKNKRKVERSTLQKSNRENIENELKLEIFKKIRETMNSSHGNSGLEVVRATMHFNQKSKPTSRTKTRRFLGERNEEVGGKKQRTFRFRTEGVGGYRTNESTQYYSTQKKAISERRFLPNRSEEKEREEINGWNIECEQEQCQLVR